MGARVKINGGRDGGALPCPNFDDVLSMAPIFFFIANPKHTNENAHCLTRWHASGSYWGKIVKKDQLFPLNS